jgi:hypothetical protein
MHKVRFSFAVAGAALLWMGLAPGGCSASKSNTLDDDGSDPTTTGPGGGNNGGMGGNPSSGGGEGAGFVTIGSGGMGGGGGSILVDPCDSECGDTELCEANGLDDDCDGQVNEGCACVSGTAIPCFKGDPSFLSDPGCFPGTQKCTELGVWGECEGGVHATDNCAMVSAGCHPISTRPFVAIDLATGTGTFSNDAVSETFTVTCPTGVSPCPTPMGTVYTPLQSGEYTVSYQKTTANGMDQCSFPLFVGAPGLRVELTWDWVPSQSTVDLDLHVHKPQDSTPWGGDSGTAEDCAWDNCTASDYLFMFGTVPDWFNGVSPPDPVDWFLDPILENNTCYFGPKGNGAEWQSIGMGCHNPRLDIDNISCDPTVTDSQSFSFCNPENINIDYPPKDQWTRVGVHYYSGFVSYNINPVVKIFCDGQLAAELGPGGFNNPVQFPPADASDRFWLVADVLFPDDECNTGCVVEPLYIDPMVQTPVLTTVDIVQQSVGPPYPPIPQP